MKTVLILCLLLTCALLPVPAGAMGNISITSTPPGATIYLDGVPAGSITPATVENVANTTHTVLLQLSGYQDYTQTNLQVNDNQTSMVSATLTNLTSSVSFSSVPAGATVYVDGVSRGTTNMAGVTVSYGSRTVLMTLAGYAAWSQTLLFNGASQSVTAQLTSAVTNGSIYFETNPVGAAVYINSTNMGITDVTLYNLTPGSYLFRLQKNGYIDYSGLITVTPGNTTNFYRKLTAEYTETTVFTTIPTPAVTAARTTRPSTLKVPTPWPSATTTQASPIGIEVLAGAVGLALVLTKKI
ncbi:MAG: PEGA domain-containing protein [Methanoregula sp.]|uniref:PEGA domain-containing protein n=1 Tax=Methanoregula sp. TaxID=2052170 RepID=UPI003D13898B